MTRARGRMRVAAILAAVLAAVLSLGSLEPAAAQLVAPASPAVDGPAPAGWPTPDDITASSWVLLEAATGQRLAEHAAEEPRPVASTVKILTVLTALQRVDLDQTVTVGDEVLVAGASVGLRPGDTWTVRQLVEAVLVRSGNDATEALATHVAGDTDAFVELMRADARTLGVTPERLGSPSGLNDENRLSALDLAVLARAALAEPRMRPLLALEAADLPGEGPEENRNQLLGAYPGATGVKTGFTTAAGNSLVASAERDGRELIAVVLDAGDDPARFRQAARLLDLGFEAFARTEVGGRLELAVAGGWREFAAPPVTVTAPAEAEVGLAVPVPAGVPDDAVTAELVADGASLTTTELVAEGSHEPVPASSPAALGAALVDGAYASLRAMSTSGDLR